jgi:glycosyltransferase involved in cell wall biosynthesis
VSRKKILLIGPAFPYRGGIANFNEALCKSFVQQGHDCEIVSFSLQYPSFFFPGTTQFDYNRDPGDLKIFRLINSISPFSWVKAARFIIKRKPDLVVVRFWLPLLGPALGSVCRLIKRGSGIPVLGLTDNVVPHEKRPGDRAFTRYFLNSCDAFVAMSQSVLDDIGAFGIKKPGMMIPHPVYDIFGEPMGKTEARRNLDIREDEKVILFFGFIRKYKGLDLLLKAMADQRIRAMGIKLVIAGEFYDDPAEYHALIEELDLSKQLILHTRYIHDHEVRSFFSASDLVVQPYHSATQSGVTQIAYHFIKPMVVTRVGGLAEMVEHGNNGYVVEPNPSAIAEAIHDFFSNHRITAMTDATSRVRARFTWEAMVKGMLELGTKVSKP